MPFGKEAEGGQIDDGVCVMLAGDRRVRFEEYTVHSAIIQQPAAFSVRLSAGSKLSKSLIAAYPINTPFVLEVAGFPQFTGRTDGWEAEGPSGSTSVALRGRDRLAVLFDNDVAAERSFTNVNYGDIVKQSFADCGITDFKILASNEINRKIRSGKGVKAIPTGSSPAAKGETHAQTIARLIAGGSRGVNGQSAIKYVVHAKLGETHLDFLHRHLARAGLFLWTGYDGQPIIAEPTKNQPAAFHFVRGRGRSRSVCNVTDARWTNDATRRFSEVVVFARNLGRKFGHNKTKGSFVDEEMVALGLTKLKTYRDVNVTNAQEAEFFARRKIAEANRGAWKLEYTFSGHTAPTIGGDRAVPVPDTIAHVEDDELGLDMDLYIESVAFKSPPRTTTVTMMRPQDLVFGSDDDTGLDAPATPPHPREPASPPERHERREQVVQLVGIANQQGIDASKR